MPSRSLLIAAALAGALGVTIGAFAAHGAGPQIRPLLQTAGHYLMIHALLAVLCSIWNSGALVRIAGWLALAGGLVFALSLYLVGPLHLRAFGAVAPIGGLLMIGGWIMLAIAATRPHLLDASSPD